MHLAPLQSEDSDLAESVKVQPARPNLDLGPLSYLEQLTFDFPAGDRTISAIAVYAEPDPEVDGAYQAVVAADTGFEGIACVDDNARASLLAFAVHERTRHPHALDLALRWLSFVEYMQYPDGSFANFIRNTSGVRNASGPTSHRGGQWWSARALRALARAYRITGDASHLEHYRACTLPPLLDGKINALLALAAMELLQAGEGWARPIAETHIERVMTTAGDAPYLLDQPDTPTIHPWGYHQLEAVAAAVGALGRRDLLPICRGTVNLVVEPAIRAGGWHEYPSRRTRGVTAYDITPFVEGLAAMHRITGARRYRDLALRGLAWFSGRNAAGTPMYDATAGRCRDGIEGGVASLNCGAESAIEAGLAEVVRQDLLAT